MIYDEQMIEIEDAMDHLVTALRHSVIYTRYQKAQQKLAEDDEAQDLIQTFHDSQDKLSAIEPYGSYVPGAADLKKATLSAKRTMDLYPMIADYKVARLNLETVIDTISVAVANSVSAQIKVATGNPFFATKHHTHHS